MGDTGDRVILYAAQAEAVLKAIERDGRCFSREEYVRRKYGESGPIFLTVYKWFVKEAVKLVPMPQGAEFPYWSFMNLYSLDQSAGTSTLTLSVPRDEAVFFDMYDWNKILCLKYLGEDEADEKAFCAQAQKYNLLLVPGSSFACPGYVRIAYCVSAEQIERSMPAFEKLAKDYNLI